MNTNATLAGQLMDLAQQADNRALFAALQRALVVIVDDSFGSRHQTFEEKMAYVRAGLEIGAELGSPEQLAARR